MKNALVGIEPNQARVPRSGMAGTEPSLPQLADTSALESEMWRFRDAARNLHQSFWYLRLNPYCAPDIGMGRLSGIEKLLDSQFGERALAVSEPALEQEIRLHLGMLIKLLAKGSTEDPQLYATALVARVVAQKPSRGALAVACQKLLDKHTFYPKIAEVLEVLNSAMKEYPVRSESEIREQIEAVREAILRRQEREQKLREDQKAKTSVNEPVGRFEDLIALADEKRDLATRTALERDVRLVRFEDGKLEIALEPGAPKSLVGELSRKLSEWTGRHWLVALSGEPGAPTIRAQRDVLAWLLRSDKPEVIAAAEEIQRALMEPGTEQ